MDLLAHTYIHICVWAGLRTLLSFPPFQLQTQTLCAATTLRMRNIKCSRCRNAEMMLPSPFASCAIKIMQF